MIYRTVQLRFTISFSLFEGVVMVSMDCVCKTQRCQGKIVARILLTEPKVSGCYLRCVTLDSVPSGAPWWRLEQQQQQ